MMAIYFVTGGAGFIGSNFVRYILEAHEDASVINVDALTYAGNLENLDSIKDNDRYSFERADIRDRETMRELISRYNPDYVVNFAAESHVDRSIAGPWVFADTNVMGTVSLLDAAMSCWEAEGGFGEHKYLQVSTDEVYGSLPLENKSEFFRENTPLNPHSPYSASKASADMFVKAYGDTYGLPVNITRCSNNYGPYQFPEKLIPLMINNALHHRELPVYGDGLNVRDWLYVDDHCKAIDLVLLNGRVGDVYNIGGHNEYANIEIVKAVISECSRLTNDPVIDEELIRFVADRKGHDRRYGIAPDKIASELGWEPETPFSIGIAKTIRWYLDHRGWTDGVTSGAYREYYRQMYTDGSLQEA